MKQTATLNYWKLILVLKILRQLNHMPLRISKMTSYRHRSMVNDSVFERVERLAINPKTNHQRDRIARDLTPEPFRSRSHTVPAQLPSQKLKELKIVKTKISQRVNKFKHQADMHVDNERTEIPLKGSKKYLKPIGKQSKISADALEDPLASSGRPESRRNSRYAFVIDKIGKW